ncbi:MAG: hypothetical protein IJT27_02295 [Clostridia bacterium]|nr:hypothetical protein [Clostridia bacterium]
MKKIANFISCLKNMERVSKIILYAANAAVLLTYGAAIAVLSPGLFHGDLSTALYWAQELWLLAKELLGATVVPVLLFEIFFYAKGLKQQPDF